MATLSNLVLDGTLIRVTVPLRRDQFHDRKLYAFPECLEWMRTEVPKMKTGRINSATSPRDQLALRLRGWMAGEEMVESEMFRHMRPLQDDVIEMKTDDLRLFGWLCQPATFVVVCGGYADDYKEPTITKLYQDDVTVVVDARNALPLDGDKISRTNFNDII